MEDWIAYALAFNAGFMFALSDVLVRLVLGELRAQHMLLLSLAVGTPFLALVGALLGEDPPGGEPAILYSAAGILNFAVGRYLFYVAVAALGAGSASVIVSPTVVLSGLLAWAILGEPLTAWDLAGLALVAISIYLAASKPSGSPLHGSRRSTGVAAGIAASLTFASTTVIVRAAGVESGAPAFGVALSYTTALPLAAYMAAKAPGGLGAIAGTSRRVLAAGVAAALIVAIAQLSRYAALSLVPVVQAVVLISLFPLHTVALASVILRGRGERVRPVHALSAGLAVAGVAAAVGG